LLNRILIAVTGFADTEDQVIGLTRVVPFSSRTCSRGAAATIPKAADWQHHVFTDRRRDG
jgi:hypothetical protein